MDEIFNVSRALHEIETQVFKDLSENPFRDHELLMGKIEKRVDILLFDFSDKNREEWLPDAIKAAAFLTRFISEII